MPAHEVLQHAQFDYFGPGDDDPKSNYVNEHHKVAITVPAPHDVGIRRGHSNATLPAGTPIRAGELTWKRNGGKILRVEVPSHMQRHGMATALLGEAKRIASANPRIPQPKHSNDRTKEGDAWARAVGGKLPRRIN